MADKTLDCRGLTCPQPVVSTKKSLEEIDEGTLTIIVDNEVAKSNVCRFLESQGLKAIVEKQDSDFYIKTVKGKTDQVPKGAPEMETTMTCSVKQKSVVYISSENMGQGDDELGQGLMATYLDTLSHFANSLDKVIFVNGGVKLTVEGSPALESIKNLENAGVKVLSCGTCLNHFGLKELLRVGEVTNMYSIIETTIAAGKVLTP